LLTRLNPHPVGHLQGRLIPTRGAFWFLCVVSHTRRAPRERRAPNARHRASAACRTRDMADETTRLLRIVSRALHHMFVRELKRSIRGVGPPRLTVTTLGGCRTGNGARPISESGQLGICALAAAPRAGRPLVQHVTRRIWPPSDNRWCQCRRCPVQAFPAQAFYL